MKTIDPPPAGIIAVIETEGDGYYYLLTPIFPDDVNPAIWIPTGSGLSWHGAPKVLGLPRKGAPSTFGVPRYVVPRKLTGIKRQLCVAPLLTKSRLGVSRDRWIVAFTAALELMEKVWKAVSPDQKASLQIQEWIASGLTHIDSADYLLNRSGKRAKDGVPQTSESYFTKVMILIHWGGLWRYRNKRKSKGDSTESPGGFAGAGAARSLTRTCHYCFPGWREMGWKDVSEDQLGHVSGEYGLDVKLP